MSSDTICPVCEEGILSPTKTIYTFVPVGETTEISSILEYSTCSMCGSEVASPEQTKRNKQRILD